MPEKVPPVGMEIDIGGFKYRVHKHTLKDMVLRPIGYADTKIEKKLTFMERLRFLIHS